MAENFEPNECVIFVQSKKIGTHENKAIHSSPDFMSKVASKTVTHPRNPTVLRSHP